ncbi:hypothetical protein [Gaoshiqia sp. Z1-71]|uniref:hypothetical protein n=1 Tax=Gaoshiqia hydrogeniformans TaxID=3290090 RepID=UPI003BF8A43C
MIQEIITYTIIAAAIGFALFRIYKSLGLLNHVRQADTSDKCGGCSADCALRSLPAAKSCTTSPKA